MRPSLLDTPQATQTYMLTGIDLDADANVLRIDLNSPRIVRVIGVNEATGQSREYLLKVTPKGLCLV